MIDLLKSGCTHKQQQAKLNEVIKTINEGNTGEGASIIVDSELSATSENPVQNKIIDAEFRKIREEIASIEISSGGPFFRDAVFVFDFSNTENNLEVNASSSKEGTLQWYSYDGESVDVSLPEIRYYIARFEEFDETQGLMRFYRDGVLGGDFPIFKAEDTLRTTIGISGIIQNLKTTFSLVCRDIHGKDFSVSINLLISFPVYYGCGETLYDVVANGTKERVSTIKGKTRTILIEDEPQYIWFITTETIESITNNGFSAGFVLKESTIIGESRYNCYRSASKIVPGTYTFDIK